MATFIRRRLAAVLALTSLVLAGVLTVASPAAAVGPDAVRPAAGVSPTMWPTPNRTYYVSDLGSFHAGCQSGNLWLAAWDPTVGRYKGFDLYACQRYYLSNWYSLGYYFDNQVPDQNGRPPVSTFYDQNGVARFSFTPSAQTTTYVWDPIWSVQNC